MTSKAFFTLLGRHLDLPNATDVIHVLNNFVYEPVNCHFPQNIVEKINWKIWKVERSFFGLNKDESHEYVCSEELSASNSSKSNETSIPKFKTVRELCEASDELVS